MGCRKFYECILQRFGCIKKDPLNWDFNDDNILINHIISGLGLYEISVAMQKSEDIVRYKIIDIMSNFSNYETVYHMGPGYKYVNYIDFIKSQYSYESL